MNPDFIIDDMQLTRDICSAVHSFRQSHPPFNSVKYPITNIIISAYLLPDFRKLIAEDCNIVGYMGIPAVEYDVMFKLDDSYVTIQTPTFNVHISTVQSEWQKELYNQRSNKRDEMLKRKELQS